MRRVAVLIAAVAASFLVLASSAGAQRGLLVGFSDNAFEWQPASAFAAARAVGADVFRITLQWQPGQSSISVSDATALNQTIGSSGGARIVLSVYGSAASAPTTPQARTHYCQYLASILYRFRSINDVVIWNEPNKGAFWRPQFGLDGSPASPSAYFALLATCYDTLHAIRASINVIAPATSSTGNDEPRSSDPSIAPGVFIRDLGLAYRASHRTARIFDTAAHHPYGLTSSELPWVRHAGGTIGEGDWQKLMSAYQDAFAGTSQPVPGEEGVTIWYLEDGFQTSIDPAKTSAYTGVENAPAVVPPLAVRLTTADAAAVDQASQIEAAVALAYCQPYVGAFLNFELWDDPNLSGWQSAPFWADHTPKPSLPAFQHAFDAADANTIDCASLPQDSVLPASPQGP